MRVTDDDCVIFEIVMGCLHGWNGSRHRAFARHDVREFK